MDLHDDGGKVLIAISSKIIESSGTNEKEVVDTKRSLGKANLPLSIITPEGQAY